MLFEARLAVSGGALPVPLVGSPDFTPESVSSQKAAVNAALVADKQGNLVVFLSVR